ncbi:taste receptor type 2 member 110-like [Octodon degus]|uniref:Taste receptor type 2 member 110-like n=1 Tax=Octodon degus TaxID=10160 RepID=A0A6P6DZN5_OCTDE|nr:taste receptor type 2 member 110-like [Octodon degus]
MVGVLNSIFIIVSPVESMIGIAGNVFIALVNLMDWMKRRKGCFVDQILTFLAISRVALLCSALTHMFYATHPGSLKTANILRMIIISLIVTNHFNIWLAMCLSLFYFLKIANFSNFIFLYLKRRVKKVVLLILLMSLVLLLFNIIVIDIQINFWIDRFRRNVSYTSSMKNFKKVPTLLLFISSIRANNFFEHAIGIAFPSGYSLALISGNSKLTQAFLSVLWRLRCRPKGQDA